MSQLMPLVIHSAAAGFAFVLLGAVAVSLELLLGWCHRLGVHEGVLKLLRLGLVFLLCLDLMAFTTLTGAGCLFLVRQLLWPHG